MAKEPQQLSDGAIDPNVSVPKHIREASAAAEALHQQAYPPAAPDTPNPDEPPAPPAPDVTATVTNQDPPAPAPDAPPPPTPDNFTAPANSQDLKDSEWAGRYNSMRGRWEASQRQLGIAQQQCADLAVELNKTQELLSRSATGTPQTPNPDTPPNQSSVIGTAEDRETYGAELLDTVARTARQVVQPELDALRGQNADLQKRVNTTAQRDAKGELTRLVPNWVAINRDPGFQSWLSLPNVYSGEVRRQVMTRAYSSADAQQMAGVFRDFINEVKATGGTVPGLRQEQQQQDPPLVPPAPRTPALDPMALAAPGRARPAGGDQSSVPAEKPTYTRAAISNFYRNVRLARSNVPSGPYVGREADIAATEADIIQAQNEGRVRG